MTDYTRRDYSRLNPTTRVSGGIFFLPLLQPAQSPHTKVLFHNCELLLFLGFQFRFCWLGEDTMLLAAPQIASQPKRQTLLYDVDLSLRPGPSRRGNGGLCATLGIYLKHECVCVGRSKVWFFHHGAGKDWMTPPLFCVSKLIIKIVFL